MLVPHITVVLLIFFIFAVLSKRRSRKKLLGELQMTKMMRMMMIAMILPAFIRRRKDRLQIFQRFPSSKHYFFKRSQIWLFLSPCAFGIRTNCLFLLILIQKRKASEESPSNPTDILTSSSAGKFSIVLFKFIDVDF